MKRKKGVGNWTSVGPWRCCGSASRWRRVIKRPCASPPLSAPHRDCLPAGLNRATRTEAQPRCGSPPEHGMPPVANGIEKARADAFGRSSQCTSRAQSVGVFNTWRPMKPPPHSEGASSLPPGPKDGSPRVSIILPCLNEAAFIETCLKSILANDYPKDRAEVLVVDGMSTDGTRGLIEDYARSHPMIRLLDNHKHTTPAALNVGVAQASGEVVLR